MKPKHRPGLAADDRGRGRLHPTKSADELRLRLFLFIIIRYITQPTKREPTHADSRLFFRNFTRHQFPALAKPRSPKPFAPKIL